MIKAFDRWSTEGIVVGDLGLQNCITLAPTLAPKSGARYAGRKFYKSKVFIVERFINKLMVTGHKSKKHLLSSGHNTGKSVTAYNIAIRTFEIIEKRTGQNPIAVLVKAIENAAPREETISIEYGGARYPKAVECAPQRRVDIALRYMIQGSYQKSFGKKKSAEEALADEIINAFNLSPNSTAISKKNELEKQADASR